ncbi:unnamed protein product [Ostreobium quekettii]|uniref:Uncharacterized protein n=1 Tax=Ostreobium quekettii TaxID=121088 RepID=A0A8S1IUC3_9CHLO|nr:unnamed protein product [Ostreobium quekettii]
MGYSGVRPGWDQNIALLDPPSLDNATPNRYRHCNAINWDPVHLSPNGRCGCGLAERTCLPFELHRPEPMASRPPAKASVKTQRLKQRKGTPLVGFQRHPACSLGLCHCCRTADALLREQKAGLRSSVKCQAIEPQPG